ncbi:MAG: hypothetical protein P3W98_014815 [Vibrio metschnikovii]|nr:hypothetical protein [Vibrio metschnikovii]MDM7486411.1 hypothetical protein [Vibrio metschnikovii]
MKKEVQQNEREVNVSEQKQIQRIRKYQLLSREPIRAPWLALLD